MINLGTHSSRDLLSSIEIYSYWIWSVSYTHLDVYKRQQLSLSEWVIIGNLSYVDICISDIFHKEKWKISAEKKLKKKLQSMS